jgi:hypothetical protein
VARPIIATSGQHLDDAAALSAILADFHDHR